MPNITPNLWFDTQAEEAARYYCDIFPNSNITNISYYGDGGPRESGRVLTVQFELDGQAFVGLNGAPEIRFSEAVSFLIACNDQAAVDHYWSALTADGGEEGQCGWLKDKYGVSWQVVPDRLGQLMTGSDPDAAARVGQALMQMKKLDVAALEQAAAG